MALPALRMERDVGEHIDGSFEHIEAPICADMVEAVTGIAALHIEPEGFAEAVGAALVGMAGDAVFIRTHENRIVVIGVFIQQLLSCKVRHNAPVDIPVLDQIGIDPAHIGIGRRKDKGLRRLLYPFFGRGINRSQLASQKHGHRLRIAEVIKPLHEADGVAAPLLGMIVPLVAADGDTMVTGQPFLSAGGKELFAPAAEELLQINGGGSLLLFFREMNVGLSSYNEQVQKTTLTLTVFVKPFLKEFFLFEIHMDVIHKIIKNITLEPMYDFLVNLVL